MLSVEDRYYKINRILLKGLGLWPYQISKWVCVQTIFIRSIYLSAIFVQLAVFITHECTLDILINVLSFTFPSIFMLFMYDMYYFNSSTMKNFMERIYCDWKTLENKAELSILNDYAEMAKLFTEVVSLLLCICISMIIMIHTVPMILDVVMPVNESRSQNIHIISEYFIDPLRYYYVLVLHLSIFVSLGTLTLTATGTMLVSYGLHVCAMFKVTNYRMKIMMDESILQISSPEKENLICARIGHAVDVHRRTIRYCRLLVLTFGNWFIVVIIIGITSLSINLFRFFKTLITFNKIIDMFISSSLVLSHFFCLFFGNHIGQKITNSNAEIFNTIYNLPWYLASPNIQKLLLFLLQKGSKNIYLSVGGMFYASYEGFAMLVKLSISYFTVIFAIQ